MKLNILQYCRKNEVDISYGYSGQTTMRSNSELIQMPSVDTYYICQMVSRSLQEMDFLRNIEGFMGDAACSVLLGNYPKFTPLHEYIEHIVTSAIFEETELDTEKLLDESRFHFGQKLWVDYLLEAYEFETNFMKWTKTTKENKTVENYLSYLQDEDILPQLNELVAKEVFHILFSDRKVLRNFGTHASYQILNSAPQFYPNKFTDMGYLKRAKIPQWAKDAIFHRDKGRCVQCGSDLTRLINLRNGLHFDHITALAKGGMNDVTNLQLLCETCNLKKSDKTVTMHLNYESWYIY
ncbi:MAG: HNH endonuclease [Chloroflexota bacterium]